MKNKVVYTDAPKEVEESLDRGIIIPNFEITKEGIAAEIERRKRKPVSIYLPAETLKAAAEQPQ